MHFNKLLLATALLFSACSPRPGKQVTASGSDTSRLAASPDMITIDKRTAVYYSPDSVQVQREVNKEEEEFYTAADDNIYYMSQARHFTDSLKLNAVDVIGQKFIKFICQDGTSVIIKKDTLQSLWGVYLFDPGKKPMEADMMNIGADYKSYFK